VMGAKVFLEVKMPAATVWALFVARLKCDLIAERAPFSEQFISLIVCTVEWLAAAAAHYDQFAFFSCSL
jgi:hypothetical protein